MGFISMMEFSYTLNNIFEILKKNGLNARLRSEHKADWNVVWQRLPMQPTSISESMIDYQHAYLRSTGSSVLDLSMVIFNDGKPCAIWPFNLSLNTQKKIIRHAVDSLEYLRGFLGKSDLRIEENSSLNYNNLSLSEWHQQWMMRGGEPKIRHELYVDLTLSIEDIYSNMRKSYRSLIQQGSKLWEVTCIDHENLTPALWNEFRELHLKAAGKVTRSEETWHLQYLMILQNEGFLLTLRTIDGSSTLIGGAFFQNTKDEGYYAVAAYDRNLFDKPIGHVLQMRAIQLMKDKNIKWYRIGERMFPSDIPKPSDKQISISNFKQGFATHLIPKFSLMCN